MSSNKGTRINSYTRINSWLSSKYPAACGGDLYLGHSHIPLRGSSLFSEKSSKLSSYGIPQLAAGYSEK